MGRIYKSGIMYSGTSTPIIWGYLYEGKFYEDAAHTKELEKTKNVLYSDTETDKVYLYNGTEFLPISSNDVDPASPTIAGIAKLYNNEGSNTDGSITQKFITDSFDTLDFKIDEEDSECLVLDKPW